MFLCVFTMVHEVLWTSTSLHPALVLKKNEKSKVGLKWKFRSWRFKRVQNHQNRSYPRGVNVRSKCLFVPNVKLSFLGGCIGAEPLLQSPKIQKTFGLLDSWFSGLWEFQTSLDFWTVGPWTVRLLDFSICWLLDFGTYWVFDFRFLLFGHFDRLTFGLWEFWTLGLLACWTLGLFDFGTSGTCWLFGFWTLGAF